MMDTLARNDQASRFSPSPYLVFTYVWPICMLHGLYSVGCSTKVLCMPPIGIDFYGRRPEILSNEINCFDKI